MVDSKLFIKLIILLDLNARFIPILLLLIVAIDPISALEELALF
jgi:hypothetical protein